MKFHGHYLFDIISRWIALRWRIASDDLLQIHFHPRSCFSAVFYAGALLSSKKSKIFLVFAELALSFAPHFPSFTFFASSTPHCTHPPLRQTHGFLHIILPHPLHVSVHIPDRDRLPALFLLPVGLFASYSNLQISKLFVLRLRLCNASTHIFCITSSLEAVPTADVPLRVVVPVQVTFRKEILQMLVVTVSHAFPPPQRADTSPPFPSIYLLPRPRSKKKPLHTR